MKKMYKNPQVDVMDIQTESLLVGSTLGDEINGTVEKPTVGQVPVRHK